MIVAEIKENIFVPFEKKEYDILIHGSNCFHTMSRGIASSIVNRYPEVYKADRQTPFGSSKKLGMYSYADTEYGRIINLYTQFGFSNHIIQVDYDAIRSGFKSINDEYKGSTS